MAYEQEELWAAISRLHQRLVRLEVVHETKRALEELEPPVKYDPEGIRESLKAVVERMEKP